MEKRSPASQLEFIALMAFLMSNVALSIDAILPALKEIGKSIDTSDTTTLQLIITMIFLGMGIGQLFFGTLSDSLGRKPIVYLGVGVFVVASFICIIAVNLEMMLLGRVLQGIGLAAPRTVSVAIIRDSYSGDKMARVMSFITVIFILVPMVAPLLGQTILNGFDWQAIFYFQLLFVLAAICWFKFRQPETLLKAQRIQLSKHLFFDGVKEFFSFKTTVVYTLISGFIEGSFILYLSSSRQIFQDQYERVEEFPFLFAAAAFVLGIATYVNGSLVLKYGMKKLVTGALVVFCCSSLTYLLLFFHSENPELPVFLTFLFTQFLALGFVYGNIGALAMQPIGHIAGIGAAINNFSTTLIAVSLAILMGRFITDSVLPLFAGFFFCSLVALVLLYQVREKREV